MEHGCNAYQEFDGKFLKDSKLFVEFSASHDHVMVKKYHVDLNSSALLTDIADQAFNHRIFSVSG